MAQMFMRATSLVGHADRNFKRLLDARSAILGRSVLFIYADLSVLLCSQTKNRCCALTDVISPFGTCAPMRCYSNQKIAGSGWLFFAPREWGREGGRGRGEAGRQEGRKGERCTEVPFKNIAPPPPWSESLGIFIKTAELQSTQVHTYIHITITTLFSLKTYRFKPLFLPIFKLELFCFSYN